jgi:hypothetical protein
VTFVAIILCLIATAVAVLGVVSPPRLVSLLRKTQTRRGLTLLAAFRVVLGVALIFSAPASLAPEFIAVVGVIVIVKGVTLPLIGVERVRRLLDWWSTQESVFLRAWALLAAAIGLWLVYALLP